VVDQLVAGIYTAEADHGDEDEYQHPSFKGYVISQEKRLKTNLKSYSYCIDDINTLSLITGPGRLEEVFLESSIHISIQSDFWGSMF
jgi:hypothetical protein